MALPTNIFLGKAKAPTPQTKKQFSTHNPWDQPALSPSTSPNHLDNPAATIPEPVMPSPITTTGNPKLVTTETQRDYKPSTKSVQTQYKPSTKSVRNPVHNLVQTQYKPSTNSVQICLFLLSSVFNDESSYLCSMQVKLPAKNLLHLLHLEI